MLIIRRLISLLFNFFLILFLSCFPGKSNDRTCVSETDCFQGEVCYNGICVPASEVPDSGYTGQVTKPQLAPTGGTYNRDLQVEITCETAGARIYYTQDGTLPSTGSSIYSSPIAVSGDGTETTLRTIAVKQGLQDSEPNSATYRIDYDTVASPRFNPEGGAYPSNVTVEITSNTEGAEIYYTLDGEDPSDASTQYTAPIVLTGDNTSWLIKAIGYKAGLSPSPISESTYTISYDQIGEPVFSPAPGIYDVDNLTVQISTATPATDLYYTTDLSTPSPFSETSFLYSDLLSIPIRTLHHSTIKAIGVKNGLRDSPVAVGEYRLPPGKYWYLATNGAQFSERCGHTSVVFDNRMWIIGGRNGTTLFNDVWSSVDGITWSLAAFNGGFSPRWGHSSVAFKDKMWVIGGDDGSYLNDVWSSPNGVVWKSETSNAGFPERIFHANLVFHNRIWVIDGDNGGAYINDAFSSENGVNWRAETPPEFSVRWGQASLMHNNRMWVVGGYNGSGLSLNDVWSSENGANWSPITYNGGFSPRMHHTAVAFDNKLWVIAGSTRELGDLGEYFKDIWSSPEGVTWTKIADTPPFSARSGHTSVVFNGRIWIMGGYYLDGVIGQLFFNDVWWSD